jgi:hypothetical protein
MNEDSRLSVPILTGRVAAISPFAYGIPVVAAQPGASASIRRGWPCLIR